MDYVITRVKLYKYYKERMNEYEGIPVGRVLIANCELFYVSQLIDSQT